MDWETEVSNIEKQSSGDIISGNKEINWENEVSKIENGESDVGTDIVEQYKTGSLSPQKMRLVEELQKRAKDVGPMQAFLIGAGKGFYNIARGIGIVDPATDLETQAMGALKKERPYTTGAGEITGEAAPFLIPGTLAGKIASIPLRVAASGAVGATEGGIVQRGAGADIYETTKGAGLGAGIGMGAEILFPVIGRLGSKIFRKVTGRAPKGALIDLTGNPTPEFKEALDASGITYEELVSGASDMVKNQKPGAEPGQVARASLFKQEGIPATKGEITKDFEQLTTEQRLLESPGEVASEPIRQFKLKQSEAIKSNLKKNMMFEPGKEETGELIQQALSGRKKLLRSKKNELYKEVSEKTKDIGGVPIFTDNIAEVVPDADTMEDLAITAPQAMESINKLLTKYGLKDPTEEMVKAGFEPTPLTISNFERFQKTLNAIGRGDQTGASSIAISPIKEALDTELDEMVRVIDGNKLPKEIYDKLKEARKTVRTLKTEFSPQSIIGKVIDVKKDGVTQITEASKIYDTLIRKSQPVENTRKLITSLKNSGEKGNQAISSLQATTLLDLIDAGFGTESRKISGVKVFNPIAFKNRMKNIGTDKINAIFENERKILKNIGNIERIATELIPPAGTQPKGSASVILDLANKLGIAGLSTKIPGGALIVGALQKIADPIKKGAIVSRALRADPDVINMTSLIERQFPGMASAMLIPISQKQEKK